MNRLFLTRAGMAAVLMAPPPRPWSGWVDMEKDAIGADDNDSLTLIRIGGDWKVIALSMGDE